MREHGAPSRRFPGMTDADVRAFALKHDLTEAQARRVLDEHGADESVWDETAHNLLHFLKAPS